MISNISIHPKTMFKNALNIQDFSFKSHTSTAIIGTNGAGKSTLINTILGIRQTIILKHKTIIFHTTTMLYHNANNWELSLTYSTTHLD
ncbi:ATP-binding cassette domain-containing protein [Helicobacter pylori]|uniref:ATP-binding cassette domain-containing protein n=1 Tax=Helicobacter pylori TaxID=210 RepID=UPI000FDF641D|nr:ATP-binding cassette domain-containing protein [Helicobacter pylori]